MMCPKINWLNTLTQWYILQYIYIYTNVITIFYDAHDWSQLQVFDSNKDGRLQLSEMAKLLPVKENFLCRQIFKVRGVNLNFISSSNKYRSNNDIHFKLILRIYITQYEYGGWPYKKRWIAIVAWWYKEHFFFNWCIAMKRRQIRTYTKLQYVGTVGNRRSCNINLKFRSS